MLTACYLLDEIRTRSKLIEVGGSPAVAMIIATAAVGAVAMQPVRFIGIQLPYVAAAGFASGFIVLGILPFIEKAFRITTGMTLLELADASQPLLRRLALEAPGTYNHSLRCRHARRSRRRSDQGQFPALPRRPAIITTSAKSISPTISSRTRWAGKIAISISAPAFRCASSSPTSRTASNWPRNTISPRSILPIIQQHHGTTVVEYFYSKAIRQGDQQPDAAPPASDSEFRYPGPKPRSKEAAIVMLCDIVESACRTLAEPTASRLEAKVHELASLRLEDGQFESAT